MPFDIEQNLESNGEGPWIRGWHVTLEFPIFSIQKIQTILQFARFKPEVNQVERHPYLQQQDLVKFCKANGIHVTNYSSLGSGDRPAARKPEGEPVLLDDASIMEAAAAVGATPAGVLLKWGT